MALHKGLSHRGLTGIQMIHLSLIHISALAGHGLAQFSVIKDVDKASAGIMTALVAVDNCFGMQGDSMVCDQPLHCFQYEVHFQRFAEHIREYLFRKSIQDRRQISKPVSYTHLDVYKRQSMMTTVNAVMPLEEALGNAEELYYHGALRMFAFIKTGMELT